MEGSQNVEEKEMEERLNHHPLERTEEEKKEEEEKFPKSNWVEDSNKIWEEEVTTETEMRKNGTCLSPTQKTETDYEWTEVKGKKKEGKDLKKKLRKKKDTTMENRFDSLDISQSSDESTNKKKRQREMVDDNDFYEKHGHNKMENGTETDLDIDLTSTYEPYLSPEDEKKCIL